MARILVTGGAGFIGSHLATRFVELGAHVRVIDNLSSGRRENLDHLRGAVELFEADLVDARACRKACADVEFVFHQAAVGSVPKSIEEPQPSHDSNINGTFNMLRAAVDCGTRRFIYAASSSAYGDAPTSPKHEGMTPNPLSPYAVQKLTGELYCTAFCRCFGIETISLRYFNVFGERQDPESRYAAAIPAFVTAILRGQPPTVYGDGEHSRDFTYIENVIQGNLLAMQAPKLGGEVVNVACGGELTINEVIAAINRVLGTNVQPRYVDPRQGDIKRSCADVRLAKKVLGYEPTVGFDEGLRRAIDYYRRLV